MFENKNASVVPATGKVSSNFGNIQIDFRLTEAVQAALKVFDLANLLEGTETSEESLRELGVFDISSEAYDLSHLQLSMLSAVDNGEIIRLDAVTGNVLRNIMANSSVPDDGNLAADIQDNLFYGVVPTINYVTSGYKRKSQAMNALVLGLAGINCMDATRDGDEGLPLGFPRGEAEDFVDHELDAVQEALSMQGLKATVKRNDDGNLAIFVD